MSEEWKEKEIANSTTSLKPSPTCHQAPPVLLMIMSTRMINRLWESTQCLRRTSLLQCIFQNDRFELIWRSTWQFFACSDSSQVPHSTKKKKTCTKNIWAKDGILDVRGWSGQLTEWQKQHKILGKALWLILPQHNLVYYTSLFNWQTLSCGFHAFLADKLRKSSQSE